MAEVLREVTLGDLDAIGADTDPSPRFDALHAGRFGPDKRQWRVHEES